MEAGKKKIVLISVISAVVLVVIITGCILAKSFFLGVFPQNTTVGGVDVSGLSPEEAMLKLNQSEDLCITIVGEDTTLIRVGDAVVRKFNLNDVISAKSDISFFDCLFHNDVSLSIKPTDVSVNAKKLKELVIKNIPAATLFTADAYFNKEMKLVKEVQGNDVDVAKFLKDVVTNLKNGGQSEYKLSDYYTKPVITAADPKMKKISDKIEKYRKINVFVKFGKKKEKIDGDMICSNLKYKKGNISLSYGFLKKYVKRLAKKYNTYGKTRKFKTHKGKVVKIKGGSMGWLMDQPKTFKKIKKKIKEGNSATVEPAYFVRAAVHGKDGNDIGKTYVEVSLSKQHLWYIKNGKVKYQTNIVSGLPTKDRMTTRGVHHIYAKQRDRYLGTMAVQGYHTHVNYWMPFHGGQGLHDATWRGSFGGGIYRSNGSHGCVNLPLSAAAKLFGMLTIGTPVVVY